ncbi:MULTISPECIES: A24 family peptidase [Sphingomonadaceae]|uniref:Prepilin peptidase n=1 Tax=Sphingomonas bisphenolicum TaxID=296544 RepID=A0ABM7G4G7_9SPHN|nr:MULTISPECIES: prepilin peptidase [Sphingomonadaceae]MBZ9647206.1 prepilin peptidase [Sphingobium sp. 3R8]BBF69496.1 prepilin peptidase [Sphingomonas bisphenolicum]
MNGEIFRLALIGALGALLIAAAITDLRSRIISNRLNLAVAALAPLWWLASGLDLWPGIAVQLLVGAIVFILFAALFAAGMMGGGDVKLLGALALWFPWQAVLSLIVLMAMLGGLVTIVTVIHHRMTKRLGQPEIPYGVAISIAALWLLGERYLNHFA